MGRSTITYLSISSATLRLWRDALHCPRIDCKLFRNDAHTGPPRSRQGLTDSFFECGGNWGPPEVLSFTSGPRKPGTDSFCNHRPFEFGKHAQHLKHRLAGAAKCGGLFLLWGHRCRCSNLNASTYAFSDPFGPTYRSGNHRASFRL